MISSGAPRATPGPAFAGPGVAAGVAGAVLIDAYLIVTMVWLGHAVSVAGLYQYVASGALGRAAYAYPQSVYLGVALHVLISLGWALGYAYVASRTPQVLQRPLVSGLVFGIVVMIAMQFVELAANIYRLPDAGAFANQAVAHTIFFGIPVAYIVSARLGRLRA